MTTCQESPSANPANTATGYARLRPIEARAVLMALVVFTAACLIIAPPAPDLCNLREEGSRTGDIALYRAEADRVHAGEDYYQAAAEELPARGYPTRSVFNWRTPLPIWLLGQMPLVEWGKGLLCLLAVAALLLAFEAVARENANVFRSALPLVVLLIGPMLPCVLGDVFCMPVLWASVFIALSLALYGVDRPMGGAIAGIAAVFFRELALPYCVLSAAIAWWHRRRGEFALWIAGLLGWAAFFAWHWVRVSQFIGPDAEGHRQGWIQFGGTAFVLATVQMNSCLLLMPSWVTVLYFVAAMFGLAGWHSSLGLRTGLTVCLFVVAFSIVGQDFNRYWGILIAPLLCFGVVRAPASLVDLWKASCLALPQRSPAAS